VTYVVGSICTGYQGLEAGLIEALGGDARVAWVADNEPSIATILAYRADGVPNLGDIKTVEWETVEPVHLMCGGFPCQPVSGAGKQKGMADERWLWPYIPAAIGRMVAPPGMLVFENVPRLLTIDRGAALAQVIYSLAALGYVGRYGLVRASSAGACHKRERWFLVAFHRETYADAARAGSQGQRLANGQPASLAAGPGAGTGRGRAASNGHQAVPQPWSEPGAERRRAVGAQAAGGWPPPVDRGPGDRPGAGDAGLTLLPTPLTGEARHGSPNQHRSRGDTMLTGEVIRLAGGTDLSASPTRAAKLMPTPNATDHKGASGMTRTRARERNPGDRNLPQVAEDLAGKLLPTPRPQCHDGGGGLDNRDRPNGPNLATAVNRLLPTVHGQGADAHGSELSMVARHLGGESTDRTRDKWRLLPTPEASDSTGGRVAAEYGGTRESGAKRAITLSSAIHHRTGDGIDWKEYEPAIRRWEAIHGPAPSPVEPGKFGKPRLAARFAEWMMGLPEGWVTGVPGLTRGQQLKAIGNGVVPHQAALALWLLYGDVT